jgi:hypothetical protein
LIKPETKRKEEAQSMSVASIWELGKIDNGIYKPKQRLKAGDVYHSKPEIAAFVSTTDSANGI